ncbi:hypothetical protein EJD97_010646 [Solanum chilense]|uniref:Uncharacterized protein n=1 Tax=Solanum chilense TaxID=4083 RepID=A0A6N2C953_SOLCI|nr:hypothetical protein EJD97_010646 [Solanum chilense]
MTQRLDEDLGNAGDPPRGNEVPPLEDNVYDDQTPINPPTLTYGDIWADFLQMSQAITTPAHAVTILAQAITTEANREVVPRANQHFGSMASSLRDLARINPPTFYGSQVKEDPPQS